MARTTKADLENELAEKKEELAKYKQWLLESEEKYNKLVDAKEAELELHPTFQRIRKENEELENLKKSNAYTINQKVEKEKRLRDKIQELLAENEQLKEKLENQTITNAVQHNARGAGRKPMSKEKLLLLGDLLKQGKKEQEICESMHISRATFYRVKKFL